ncbi:unnamed protein product [Polarella glacialis]|uniref:DAGKc domain-containing protein n=1 Tax=Polarella glacialis TaxID=89957 RepID=A0A813EQI3_POLGL|nr:unnamed protein product [Polarella glacialis]
MSANISAQHLLGQRPPVQLERMTTESRWWGRQVSEILVDASLLDPAERLRLGLPGCCDGAAAPLLGCSLCCVLGVLVPVALLVSQDLLTLPALKEAVPLLACALFLGGLCSCCFAVRRTCCDGIFNVPEPAPLIPPLSQKAGRRHVSVRRVLLIYNPKAGKQLAEAVLREVVLPGLQERGVQCHALATERSGHARELAMSLDLAPYDALVTLGGDGTFHELVNGMLAREDRARVPVTLIPLGSGNGLSATLRQNMRRRGEEVSVWSELEDVLAWSMDRVAGGRVVLVDLLELEVGHRRLVAIMQVYLGLLAEVDILAEPFRWLGPARFELVSVWNIFRKQARPLNCRVKLADGSSRDVNQSAIGASIGLSQHFEDKMRAAPNAQLDDGLAEFGIIPASATVDELLAGFLQLAHGAHTHDASTIWQSLQVREAEFFFDGPGVFNVDGEILAHSGRLRLKVLPRSLEVLVGREEWDSAGPASETAEVPRWRASGERWAMLAIFCVTSMSNQAIWIGFAPIQREVMEAYGVSAGWVNFQALVFMILYLPANFPASYMMDTYGCRFALTIGSTLNVFGALLRCVQPVGPGVPAHLLVAGQVVCALAQPFFTDMPPKIAAVWFPAYQRVLADTIASMAGPVGAAVGFVLPAALGLQWMLYAHFAWSAIAAGLVWGLFRGTPPTPPSPLAERLHSGGADFGAELSAALSNGRLWCLITAFACAICTFNCISTLVAELTQPFGFSADDASTFGVLTVAFGIVGAAVMTAVVGYTHEYKPVLIGCLVLCIFFVSVAGIAIAEIGSGPGGLTLMNLAFAGLGFAATPIMPVAFEAAVEVGFPAGEGTLAGLCMSGGQVLGIVQTELVSQLLQSGYPRTAWAVSGGLFVAALFAMALFQPKKSPWQNAEDSDASSSCWASPLLAPADAL